MCDRWADWKLRRSLKIEEMTIDEFQVLVKGWGQVKGFARVVIEFVKLAYSD